MNIRWERVIGGACAGLALVIVGGLAVLHALPGDRLVSEVAGVDSYAYHKPFFRERKIEQSFITASPTLSRIDVLVVDLKRAGRNYPLILELREKDTPEILRRVEVLGGLVRDDYYLPFSFTPLSNTLGRQFTFTLSSPAATADAPYAVRLTEDKQGIAWRQYESITQWIIWQQWLVFHRAQVAAFITLLILSGVATILIPQAAISTKYLMALLLLTVIAGSMLQWQVARQLVGDPGGDAYYYLVAAHQLAHGENPLAEWSFRLPFYSVLLMPAALPGIPDMWWGRVLGALTTIGLGVVLILLSRSLRLRPVVGLVAFMLLYFSSDFVVTSVRPRPHTLHTLLLLLSVALLWRLSTLKQALVWGVVLGLAGMTRQEAYVPIGIMGIVFLIQLFRRHLPWPETVKRVAAVAIPFFIIISPYLWANYQQFGNPFDSPYFHKSDTPQARTLTQFFSQNSTIAAQKLSHTWLAADKPNVRPDWMRPLLAATIILGGLRVIHAWRRHPRWPALEILSAGLAVVIGILLYQWLFRGGNDWNQQLNLALLAAALVGGVDLIRIGRWRAVVLFVIILTQIVLATWYNPIARLFQAVYPLVALAVAASLLAASGLPIRENEEKTGEAAWRPLTRLSPLVAAVAFLGVVSVVHVSNAIDEINFPAAPYYVTTMAAENLEQYPPGASAAEVEYTEGDGMFRLHSYQQRSLLRFPEVVSSAAEQWQWLCHNNVRYVIDHDDLSYLTVHQDPRYQDNFKFLFEEKAYGRDSRLFRTRTFELSGCDSVV